MNDKSNMGKAFSDAFKTYTIEPSAHVWENVSRNIPAVEKSFFQTKAFIFSAAAIVAAVALSVFLFVNEDNDATVNQKLPQTNPPALVNDLPAVSTERDTLIPENNMIENRKKQEKSINVVHKAAAVSENKIEENTQNENERSEVDEIQAKTDKSSGTRIPEENKHIQASSEDTDVDMKETNRISLGRVDEEPAETETSPAKDTSISYCENPVICFGEDARLEVYGGETYLWSNGDILSYTTVQPVNNSDYTVTVTDKYGSKHVHRFHVTVDRECTSVFVPSAFTPNGDGNNDIFKVYGENIEDFQMTIMNRQGQVLFTSKDINRGWDGSYHGDIQPPQVYVYTIVYKNGRGERKILKGQFTLVK